MRGTDRQRDSDRERERVMLRDTDHQKEREDEKDRQRGCDREGERVRERKCLIVKNIYMEKMLRARQNPS